VAEVTGVDVDLIEKTCTKCGETFSLSGFHRRRASADGHRSECKSCSTAAVVANRDRRRAEIGEDAWKAHKAAIVAKHRERTGNKKGKEYSRQEWQATKVLRERHAKEWEHLLLLARRDELPRASPDPKTTKAPHPDRAGRRMTE